MSKFIELTADDQTKIIINTALIGTVVIEPDSGCTVIIDTQGEALKVEEQYKEVKVMLMEK